MNSIYENKKGLCVEKIYTFLLYVILNLVYLFLVVKSMAGENERWIQIYTVLTIIQLIMNLYCIKIISEQMFSLANLFLIFTYIFNCSHLVLTTFNIDVERSFDVMKIVSTETLKSACLFITFSQFFLVLGMCIPYMKKISPKIYEDKRQEEKLRKSYSLGLRLIFIGILPKLYIDITKMIAYLGGNYLSTYKLGIPSIISILALTVEVGIIFIIIGKKNNKKACRKIFIYTMMYQMLIMLTGNRGRPTVFIVALIYLYINVVEKVKIRQVISYGLLAYTGMIFINFTGKIRMLPIENLNQLIQVMGDVVKESPLFQMMGEFGGTLINLCYAIIYFPLYAAPSYGINYMLSLLAPIPKIGSIFNERYIYVEQFPKNVQFALGGSYLGELYYNFNGYGIFFSMVIGLFIGTISMKIYKSIKNNEWIKLGVYMTLFPNILWWVRNYFSDLVREFVFVNIFILIILIAYKKKIKKKKY